MNSMPHFDIHDGVSNEQSQEAECYQSQPADVQETTFSKQLRELHLLLVIWVRVVKVVIFLHIFREQQQASRGQDVIFLAHGLRVHIIVTAGS